MGKEEFQYRTQDLNIIPASIKAELPPFNPHPAYRHFKNAMLRMGSSLQKPCGQGSEDLIRYLNNGAVEIQSSFYSTSVMGGLSICKAFNCIKDEVRTRRFLEAIEKAVLKRLQFEDEVIVFEAGCGPLAPLSIFAASIDKRVKVHAIDINPYSLNLAQAAIQRLGLQDQIKLHQGDATKLDFRHLDINTRVGVLISETMMSGLREEPIVEILNCLVPQCSRDAIVIPSEVVVGLAAYKVDSLNYSEKPISNQRVLTSFNTIGPQKVTELTWRPGEDLGRIVLELDLSGEHSGIYSFSLYSRVSFGGLAEELDVGESDITHSTIVFDPNNESLALAIEHNPDHSQKRVAVEYQPGSQLFDRVEVISK